MVRYFKCFSTFGFLDHLTGFRGKRSFKAGVKPAMAILTKTEGRTEAEIDVQVDMVIKEIDEPKLHQYIPL